MAGWEVALVALAILAGLWTLVALAIGIPLILTLRRSGQRIDNLLREVELNLGPALLDLREALRNANKTSASVADGVAQAGRAFEAVGEVGRTLQGANAVLRAALGPGVTSVAGLIVGVRAGVRVLTRRLFRRR